MTRKNLGNTARLIFNPNAGQKRNLGKEGTNLEEITGLLDQYQIPVDPTPTKKAGDATVLAKEAAKLGYKTVLVAGGDGSVGEAANGLAGTEVNLGIIPIGTFMNTASMLSIPLELEKAIELIKIGRTRKIDLGVLEKQNGKKGEKYYFIESAGVGLEAKIHRHVWKLERGNKKAILGFIRDMFKYSRFNARIELDDNNLEVKTHMITVSNGPLSGASLTLAPGAKLNDHELTVSIYMMNKFEILNFFAKIFKNSKFFHPDVLTFKTKRARIETDPVTRIHADATFYNETPVGFSVWPNALNVISGFPKDHEQSLIKRTSLDP
jgi:diacylglycerol kinase (ATP)